MPRKLHIGAKSASPGWEVLNVTQAPYVDHVGNANDLSRFEDNAFAEIYASHVLEHLDYQGELQKTLTEWRRVLAPAGTLHLSVPDMDVLSRLFLDKEHLNPQERFFVMQMMFGGHADRYDYHVVGLNEDFLTAFLHGAGFTNIRRVPSLGLFEDTSAMAFKGVAISLNLQARK